MAYEMLTRTGRNFYEITSVMQHGIRKGDYEVAGYCTWELLPRYTPYLRKRLLVISAEDCFGIITKEILKLSEEGNAESIEKAVKLLCACKKNRDADYFVCNLMDSKDPTGESKENLAKMLHTAIRKRKIIEAGKISAELFQKNRRKLWEMLNETAMVYYPHLVDEVKALNESNEKVTKPNEETIFAAKAMVLMWTERENRTDLLGCKGMRFDSCMEQEAFPKLKSVEECRRLGAKELFPEWAYNWHTIYGKYALKRDAVHAISNDQRILTPLEENLFDDCSWNKDINACLMKWNPKNRRLPYDDGLRDPREKYGG